MAKPCVVLTHPFHRRALKEELAPHFKVRVVRSRRELERAIGQADALITRFSDPVDARLLARAPRLKVVANVAVGYDNIDRDACRARGVRVVNTPDVLTRATAELTLALLLAAARRIPEGDALCRRGRFRGWAPDMLLGQELHGRVAGIVGAGRIGKETARLFRAIGIRTRFITRQTSTRDGDAILRSSQIVSLHVSLNPDTRHWLSSRRLSLLRRDCIVLNTTRGPVVDESALIRALQARRIFAAGLDVYEREPAIPAALRKLPNVVLLPHLGSATEHTRERMARLAFTGARAILHGKRPRNEVKF